MKAHALAVLIPVALLAACSRSEAPAPTAPAADAVSTGTTASGAAAPASAVAMLASASGSSVVGELMLNSSDAGVSITGEISGLNPGSEHGFHVHEKGDCSAADAESAGAHFNPAGVQHGSPQAAPRHVGDLPNIMADEQGRATIAAAIGGATLRDAGPNDLIGKAVIIHEKRDDYVTQPAGDSGARIACGVIR